MKILNNKNRTDHDHDHQLHDPDRGHVLDRQIHDHGQGRFMTMKLMIAQANFDPSGSKLASGCPDGSKLVGAGLEVGQWNATDQLFLSCFKRDLVSKKLVSGKKERRRKIVLLSLFLLSTDQLFFACFKRDFVSKKLVSGVSLTNFDPWLTNFGPLSSYAVAWCNCPTHRCCMSPSKNALNHGNPTSLNYKRKRINPCTVDTV